jgi:hypothetical protein
VAIEVTITLNDIGIESWKVDLVKQRVIVHYYLMTSTGEHYEYGEAIFWANLPTEGPLDPAGQPTPVPDNWYQLPVEYIATLTDLTADARSALLHLVNE